jgi:hypothetical protein
MNYHFRIISSEIDDFVFEILCDSNMLFVDLHYFIQEKLDFDKSQLASFLITDSEWNKEREITLLDMMDEEEERLLMENVRLCEQMNDDRQRMLYVFDMFTERCLFIELIGSNEEDIKTPVCLKMEGKLPKQISDFLKENFDADILSDSSDGFYDDDLEDGIYDDNDLSFDDDNF